MSLLDIFNSQDPAVRQGLLQAGLSLLQSKGNFGSALGQAGAQGLLGVQQSRDRALQQKRMGLQDEMVRNQLDQQKREAELAKLSGQFFRPPSAPVVDATGGMDTAAENPVNSNAGRFDIPGYTQAMMGIDPMRALQFQAATRKEDPKLQEIDPTKSYGTWVGGKFNPAIQGAPKSDDTEAIKNLKAIYGEGTPAYKAALQRLGIKQTTHSPQVSVSLGQPIAGVDASGNPVFFQQPKAGGAPVIVPGVRPSLKADKDLTDAQAKANLFGTRAQESDRVLTDLAKAGVGAPSIAQQMTNPSGVAGRVATAAASPQQQQVDQAQRDFINAVLRRESGAVIADTEFANARLQYFPQPGDAPQVIAQKARNRKVATEGILAEVPSARRGVPSTNSRPEAPDNDPLGLRR